MEMIKKMIKSLRLCTFILLFCIAFIPSSSYGANVSSEYSVLFQSLQKLINDFSKYLSTNKITPAPQNAFLAQLTPSPCSTVCSGLMGYWTFDEGSGTTTTDSSGNANGTLVGSGGWTTGQIGQAYNNNSTSFVSLPAGSIQAGTGNLSVSVWANYQASSGWGQIIATKYSGGGGQPGYSVGYSGPSTIYFHVDNGSTVKATYADGVSSGWHHIVATFVQGSSMNIYVDGALKNSLTNAVPSGNITGVTPPRIGDIAQYAAGDNRVLLPFTGYIDDVRVYNRVISSSEISQLYTMSGGTVPPPAYVNGVCGSTTNSCSAGTFSNTTDSQTQYLWNCVGENNGSTANCSSNIPVTPGDTAPPGDTTPPSATAATLLDVLSTMSSTGRPWMFLGDSITTQNIWSAYMESYFQLRYPNLNLHFMQAGSSGRTFSNFMYSPDNLYGKWIEPSNPSVVSVMMSTNGGAPLPDVWDVDFRKTVSDYIIAKNNAIPILLTSWALNQVGGTTNARLDGYGDKVRALGMEKGYLYADIFHYIDNIWTANRASNTITINGGVAPGDVEHQNQAAGLGATYALLSQLGATGDVSSVTINASTRSVESYSNATVGTVTTNAFSGIDFTRKDDRLPMAFDDEARTIFQIMPQVYDLNKYMLTVKNLDANSNYDIYVDGVKSATVSSATLASGWNMTSMIQGPIHDQLKDVINKIRLKEGVSTTIMGTGYSCIQGGPSMTWTGVCAYEMAASTFYDLGQRGDTIRQSLTTGVYGNHFAKMAIFDAAIDAAAQPIQRSFSIRKSGVSSTDTTPPTVSMTAPMTGLTVSGTNVTVSASASDNVAVAGVQFKLDGANLGAEDITSPYSITWDTTQSTNATHALTAIARDTAGNTKTSASVSVTVNNNLIDTTPPVITNTTPSTFTVGTTQSTMSVTTNENATCRYGTISTTSYDSMTIFSTTGNTSHSTIITGLSNGVSRSYYVKCKDAIGNTSTSSTNVSFTVSNQVVAGAHAWSYAGIPYTDWAYDPFTYPTPTRPTEWPSAPKANYYFIAPDDPNATDTALTGEPKDANGKRFGYPNKPRKTLPLVNAWTNSFPAGTVFWLKGGTYSTASTAFTPWSMSVNGNSSSPFWIYGDPDDKPVFTNPWISLYSSQYGFIENIIWDNAPLTGGSAIAFSSSGGSHHIAIRNCLIQNRQVKIAANGTAVKGSLIAIAPMSSSLITNDVHDIVAYKMTFKNNGKGVNWDGLLDPDMHAFKINGQWGGSRAYRIWIIENQAIPGDTPDPIDGKYKSLSGDLVQVGEGNVAQGNADHVFVAGNFVSSARQCAVGTKRSADIIVSSNTAVNLNQDAGNSNDAFNVKYDRQDNIWFIGNYAKDTDAGLIRGPVDTGGAGGPNTENPDDSRLYVIGNVFTDMMREKAGGWPQQGIDLQDSHGNVYIENNVINNSVYGVTVAGGVGRQSSISELHINNNIFSNIHSVGIDPLGGLPIYFETRSGKGRVFTENNLFDSSNSNPKKVVDSGIVYTSIDSWNNNELGNTSITAPANNGNIVGVPLFVNPASYDFRLQSGSPAINAGVINYVTNLSPNVYQQFINRYTGDPDFPGNPADVWPKDMAGNPRIINGAIDIGAYEYGGAGATQPLPDTTKPTVSITSPTNGSTVSGSVNLATLATDNVGIVGVRFKLDGANIDPELTTPTTGNTYSGTWNTIGVSNGAHILTAVAKDAAGNTTTSSPINITVNNTTVIIPPAGGSSAAGGANNTAGGATNAVTSPTGTFTPAVTQIPIQNNSAIQTLSTTFPRNLSLNSTGNDVKTLQIFLNSKGYTVSITGPGSKGKETTFFGNATMSALKKLQTSAKLPATGILDQATRKYINSQIGTTSITGTLSPDKLALLASLQKQLAQLIVLLQEAMIREGTPATTIPTPSLPGQGTSPSLLFPQNLWVNMQSPDVKRLQLYLNSKGFIIATEGPGSPGNESDRFGNATIAALKKFQASVGVPQSGGLDEATRLKMK